MQKKAADKARQVGMTRRYWWLAVLVVAAATGLALVWMKETPPVAGQAPAVSPAATASGAGRRETRPTLDPERFVGKAKLAHEVARDIPDVLDQLYCYCECDKQFGHKSLLSCYTDGHAAT